MKHEIALARDITTSRSCASADSVHFSDGFLRNNVIVVVAAAIFLSLGELVLRTSGTFEMFAGSLPVQLLIFIHLLWRIWRGHLPAAVIQLTTLLWRDPSVVTRICADLGASLDFGARELVLNNAVYTSVVY